MTAMNGFVQPAGAYLLTDGAVLDGGKITAIGSKVLVLSDQHIAIAWSGYAVLSDISAGLAGREAAGQAATMQALPAVLRDMHAKNVKTGVTHPTVRLLVALWSDKADEPQLWAIHSDQVRFGPAYSPFSAIRLMMATDTPPDDLTALFGQFVPNEPATFDVERDGLKLINAQRRDPEGFLASYGYSVGGFAHLTSVTRAGVEEKALEVWPDRVGESIDPHRQSKPSWRTRFGFGWPVKSSCASEPSQLRARS